MADTRVGMERPGVISLVAPFRPEHLALCASWLLAAANAGIIVWLWLAGGGISSVHNTGEALTSLGRITGLLAAYLLLIQLLLLARLPWIERPLGFDRLTRWHRLNGKLCLYLVLAHVVAITLGYAAADRLSIPGEIRSLLTMYPGMVEATIGTALMIATVVTSLVIVRRHLRYEMWYLVHLTAYAAIVLAWFHQIPTGNEFVLNRTAAAYWTALYLVTLGLLVVYRLARPAVLALGHDMRVESVMVEGPGVVSLRIVGRRLDRLGARPGQFFLWRFLTRRGWAQAHPFSLSAAPDGRSLRITVKALGDFSARMGDIRPGTRVVAEGPFGAFTSDARRTERVALIAGGIGITPVRALMEELEGDVVVIYRVARPEDLIFRDELERLSRERGIAVRYAVGDHTVVGNERLLSPEHLQELIPDIDRRDVYVCGPAGMAEAVERNVLAADVPRSHIHLERFAL